MQLRKQTLLYIPLGLASLAMIACSASPFKGSYMDLAQRDIGSLDQAEHGLLVRAERSMKPDNHSVDATTAEDYVLLALARNPSLRSAQQRVLRLQERIPQVTSLEDPRLQVTPLGEVHSRGHTWTWPSVI